MVEQTPQIKIPTRMAAAREILVEQQCRVSEAAMAVGYTNVSHFIAAFVSEHGVRPGSLARLVRAKASNESAKENVQFR